MHSSTGQAGSVSPGSTAGDRVGDDRERARLAALDGYGLLSDVPLAAGSWPELDAVLRLAVQVSGLPNATLNLIDADHQRQLATVGFVGCDSAREHSMCGQHFLSGGPSSSRTPRGTPTTPRTPGSPASSATSGSTSPSPSSPPTSTCSARCARSTASPVTRTSAWSPACGTSRPSSSGSSSSVGPPGTAPTWPSRRGTSRSSPSWPPASWRPGRSCSTRSWAASRSASSRATRTAA